MSKDSTNSQVKPNNSRYIPEFNYKETEYAPLKNGAKIDLCGSCKSYYKTLYEKKITSTPFPPNCKGHVVSAIAHLKVDDFESLEEYTSAIHSLDPIMWAKTEFNWEPRWYQNLMLSCTSKKKLYRAGRRLGKTVGMVVEILYHSYTRSNFSTLVVAPFEAQVATILDEIRKMYRTSPKISSSITRDIRTPGVIEFANGSMIKGFSAGPASASRSDKIRGQDANLIVIDEVDSVSDDDLDAVLAILASHPDCRLLAASTPRGWRRKFYSFATDKDLGYKEFWFISAESPNWTPETETYYRNSYSATAYAQEYLAEFVEHQEGVFKKKQIDASLQEYDMEVYVPEPKTCYIFGVDWNKSAGTHIVIVKWDGKLTLVKKVVVSESEFIQTSSVSAIIQLNQEWRPKWIFVDRGYGSTQVELLKKHGMEFPASGLVYKLVDIAMNQHVTIKDPLTHKDIHKPAKPYLVQQTAKYLEDGFLIIPRSEDTNTVSKDYSMGLVQQMREFIVESYSVYNLPRYSQGNDHTLTAYILAVGGFVLKEGPLKELPIDDTVMFYSVYGEGAKNEIGIQVEGAKEEATNQLKDIAKVLNRDLGENSVFRSTHGMENIASVQKNRQRVSESSTEDSRKILDNTVRRNNLSRYKRGTF